MCYSRWIWPRTAHFTRFRLMANGGCDRSTWMLLLLGTWSHLWYIHACLPCANFCIFFFLITLSFPFHILALFHFILNFLFSTVFFLISKVHNYKYRRDFNFGEWVDSEGVSHLMKKKRIFRHINNADSPLNS